MLVCLSSEVGAHDLRPKLWRGYSPVSGWRGGCDERGLTSLVETVNWTGCCYGRNCPWWGEAAVLGEHSQGPDRKEAGKSTPLPQPQPPSPQPSLQLPEPNREYLTKQTCGLQEGGPSITERRKKGGLLVHDTPTFTHCFPDPLQLGEMGEGREQKALT